MVIFLCIEAFKIAPTSLSLILGCHNGRAMLLLSKFSVIKLSALYLKVDLHMNLLIEKCGVSTHNKIFNAKPFSCQLAPASRH